EENKVDVAIPEETNFVNEVLPVSIGETEDNGLTNEVEEKNIKKNGRMGNFFKKTFSMDNMKKKFGKTSKKAEKKLKKGFNVMKNLAKKSRDSFNKLLKKGKPSSSSSSDSDSNEDENDRKKRFLKLLLPKQVSSQIKDIGGHVLNHLF
uniref:RRP15-like protein n=1 Tax=Strongyloides papillosus TaxID=174720 RepID=A0A0N5BH28_STREA